MSQELGSAVEPASPAATAISRWPWLVLVAAALGAMMDALDTTVVAVANPSIAADLHATLPGLQWVTNGYMLATAVFLITAGKLGDRFGYRRLFFIGLGGFVFSSVLVGLSGSIEMMVIFRITQGASGSLLMPTGMALLMHNFPPDKVKSAIGVFAGTFAITGASGPFIGGVIVQFADWRWVFFLNVAIGAIAFVTALVVVPAANAPGAARAFDVPGGALLSLSLLGFVLGVIEVPVYGWTDAYPLTCFALGTLALAGFMLREIRTTEPLIPLKLFRVPSISAAVVATLVAGGLMFGTWFFLALYLQTVHQLTPLQAGLGLIPINVLFLLGAPLGGQLNQRLGPKIPVAGGLDLPHQKDSSCVG